jgi:hypothetical protein
MDGGMSRRQVRRLEEAMADPQVLISQSALPEVHPQ